MGVVFGLSLSAGAAAELKIGVVNATEVLEKAPQKEAAGGRLEQEFSGRRNKLQSEFKEIKQLEEKLAKDGVTMSEGERAKAEKDLLVRKRDFARAQDELNGDLNIRRNEELNKLQQTLLDAIQTVGKEESYDLILAEGVAYVNPKIDLTEKVLQRMKDKATKAKK
ncbi:MAG: OmpH family outer membrane protein [Gammaproteobacteria bacterium]|nr:OmpH family outer membrane protein [Gammaproteobacteria bacterium]